jgi:tetrahydromethanopterin:alpha-L-glutamate ligase
VIVTANGTPTVLEVNSMPAWSGLQKVSAVNIAKTIASAVMDEIARRPARSRAI